MRILVFSDSHQRTEDCIRTAERIVGVDMIIHAGDHAADAEEIECIFPDIKVKYVRGNCDFSCAPNELFFEAEGKKIFVTHGHGYNVKNESELGTLKRRARELGADIVIFGHTHQPLIDNDGKMIVMNPGSIRYTRTYGVIEIENGKIGTSIVDCV